MDDFVEEYGDVCIECKYCVYSGLPGAYCCVLDVADKGPYGFTDIFDTCKNFTKKDEE